MAENTENRSKRDLMVERLQGRYPDKEFADDEAVFDQISTDYDDYDNQLNGYKEREQGMADLFASNPQAARLVMSWKDGDDPTLTLIRMFGTDIKDAIDDPERQEEIAAANKEYMERVAKEEEYEEQYKNNLQESIATLERIKEEKGLSDDDMDKAMEWLTQVTLDAVLGKFAPETLMMALKAQGFEDAVAQAAEEAEVRGRNARIEEKLRNKARGDGMANLDSRNAGSGVKAPTPDLGALGNYGDNSRNIWERGGERRIHNDRG